MPKDRERVKKKKWTTPQLIVLVRGKPEEGGIGQFRAVMVE